MGSGFNSYEFILIFLPLVVSIYFMLGKFKKYSAANTFLLIANLVFYMSFSLRFVMGIIIIILTNYLLGNKIRTLEKATKNQFILLVLTILINIGVLLYFKYTNFFITTFNEVIKGDFNLINIIIPLGISFFTFSQISYLVDTYRGETKKTTFINFSVYSSLFITIMQGPISYYNEIIPVLTDNNKKKFNFNNFSMGLYGFILGLGKKVLIADTIGAMVSVGFDNISNFILQQ